MTFFDNVSNNFDKAADKVGDFEKSVSSISGQVFDDMKEGAKNGVRKIAAVGDDFVYNTQALFDSDLSFGGSLTMGPVSIDGQVSVGDKSNNRNAQCNEGTIDSGDSQIGTSSPDKHRGSDLDTHLGDGSVRTIGDRRGRGGFSGDEITDGTSNTILVGEERETGRNAGRGNRNERDEERAHCGGRDEDRANNGRSRDRHEDGDRDNYQDGDRDNYQDRDRDSYQDRDRDSRRDGHDRDGDRDHHRHDRHEHDHHDRHEHDHHDRHEHDHHHDHHHRDHDHDHHEGRGPDGSEEQYDNGYGQNNGDGYGYDNQNNYNESGEGWNSNDSWREGGQEIGPAEMMQQMGVIAQEIAQLTQMMAMMQGNGMMGGFPGAGLPFISTGAGMGGQDPLQAITRIAELAKQLAPIAASLAPLLLAL